MLKILQISLSCFFLVCISAYAQTQLPKEITVQGTEQFKKGDKGTFSGAITRIDNGKVTVKGEKKTVCFYVKQAENATKHGVDLDKDMMEKISTFSVGDKVRINWIFDLHMRIDSIEKAE